MEDFFKTNQALWDQKTIAHLETEFYNLEGFLAGETSLQSIELEALADRVAGKTILHLQCHFGQDSLSFTRMGAQVTGVDFSPKAIEVARSLNQQLGLNAQFICSSVYDLPLHLKGQFDIVFTSYGVITWLPDLNKWAAIIARYLKSDGLFYMAEFHPSLYMYDHDQQKIGYRYFGHQYPYEETESGTYADDNADINLKEFFWSHDLAATIQPLLNQQLQLRKFREFDYSPYDCFPNMTEVAPDKFVYGDLKNRLPHVFSLEMKAP